MTVEQALVKTAAHVQIKLTTTNAPVPLDIQERVVKLVSTIYL